MTEVSTSQKFSKIYGGFLVLVLAFTCQACSANQQPAAATENQPAVLEPASTPAPTIDIQPTLTTSATQVAPPPTVSVVTITAVEGDLAIRKGPDMSFDAITKLQDGETATVLARSIMDDWVQIEIPSQPGETGWVSVQTNYSILNGNLLDLPRIDAVEWTAGSYLINCTPHQMLVKPGDLILQPVDNAPANRVWFSPGTYSVFDLDVTSQPVAANLRVTEHREYHILKDGNRKQWGCPWEAITQQPSMQSAAPSTTMTVTSSQIADPSTTTIVTPTSTPDFRLTGLPAKEDGTLVFDFVEQMCAAEWSTRGQELPCTGDTQSSAGYIMQLDGKAQGLQSNMNVLLAYTPQENFEAIYGKYPAVTIQKGDHFRTVLACRKHSFCDVGFELNFSDERGSAGLESWHYMFIDEPIVVDYPLDALAGHTVQFTLAVRAHGNPVQAYAVWVAPHIYRPAP